MHGFLSVERHVFVDGVFSDVFVSGIVEGDKDVEEDDHNYEGENVVENDAEWRGEVIEAREIWGLHYCICH